MTIESTLFTLAQAADRVFDDLDGGNAFMPKAASPIAEGVDAVFGFIYWISLFFFALIVGLMVYFVAKYRRKDPEQKAESQVTHHTGLELTWTIIPLLLSVVIFYVGLEGYVAMRTVPANPYEVNVVGQQWNWTFEHRNGAKDVQVLKVPSGQPVKLVMSSTDVLHSFWIPAFRVKQDVVPGRYTTLWFEAEEPGTYQIFCSEYCGTAHSQMAAILEVLEPEEFERQIAEDAAWLDKTDDELLFAAGHRVAARCTSCHSLQAGVRMTGPSWWETHDAWGEERVMADGQSIVVDENYVRESILVPAAHVLATYDNAMPSFQGKLSERALLALVEFIKRLDEVVDRNGELIINPETGQPVGG